MLRGGENRRWRITLLSYSWGNLLFSGCSGQQRGTPLRHNVADDRSGIIHRKQTNDMKRYRDFKVNVLAHHPGTVGRQTWFPADSSSRMFAVFLCQLHNIQPLTQPEPPRESDTEMLTDEQQREIRGEKQGRREEERFSPPQAVLVPQFC